MNKKSFVLYNDQGEIFDKLTDEQAGKLIKHIFAFQDDEAVAHDDNLIDIVFTSIKTTMCRDAEKWQETRKQKALSGKLGGLAKASNAKQGLAKASNAKQSVANLPVSSSVSGSESSSEVQEKESTKEKPAKKTRAKKDNFNAFFKQYPAHRKGGTSSQAWKAWLSEGLGEDDAALALSWLGNAAKSDKDWEIDADGQFVLGITKFIRDHVWLTPLPSARKEEATAGFDFHKANKGTDWINGITLERPR